MFPFYLPIILWESYLRRRDQNPLHDKRIKLTGEKKVAISKSYDFLTVKKASRSLNTTINELMVGALSTAMSRLFKEHGDEKSKRMRIFMPCNIRWKYYNTYDEVKLENKFAPMPLKIDLLNDPLEALKGAKRVSQDMKKKFAKVYAIYFLGLLTTNFVPTFMLKIGADKISKPFTMAFSNVPGILEKVEYKGCRTLGMISSFVCAGRLPTSVSILSYHDTIKFCILTDTCVKIDPKKVRDCLEKSIDEILNIALQK